MAVVIRRLLYRHIYWASIAGSAVMLLLGCAARADFNGTELSPTTPAAPFTLTNQLGQPVSLFGLKGMVVVVAFIYTNCPDVCPLTTKTLGMAYETLGSDVEKTAFVAITVDPERDTMQQAYRYSEDMGMLRKWSFLTGSRQELEPVWRAYYVDAEKETSQEAGAQVPSGGYLVSHATPIYLIDRVGRLRIVITTPPLVPQPLIHDIRLLLKEK